MRKILLATSLACCTLFSGCDEGTTAANAPGDSTGTSIKPTTSGTSGKSKLVDSSTFVYMGIVLDPFRDAGSVIYSPYGDSLEPIFRVKGDSVTVSLVARSAGSYRIGFEDSNGDTAGLGSVLATAATPTKPDSLTFRGRSPGIASQKKLTFWIRTPGQRTTSHSFSRLDSAFLPKLSANSGHAASLTGIPNLGRYETSILLHSRDSAHWRKCRDEQFTVFASNGVNHLLAILDLRNMSGYSSSDYMSISSNLGRILHVSPMLVKDTREIPTDLRLFQSDTSSPTLYSFAGMMRSGDGIPMRLEYSEDSIAWHPYGHENYPRADVHLVAPGSVPAWFRGEVEAQGKKLRTNVVHVMHTRRDALRIRLEDRRFFYTDPVTLSWGTPVPDSVAIYRGSDCESLSLLKTLTRTTSAKIEQSTDCYQVQATLSWSWLIGLDSDLPDSNVTITSNKLIATLPK